MTDISGVWKSGEGVLIQLHDAKINCAIKSGMMFAFSTTIRVVKGELSEKSGVPFVSVMPKHDVVVQLIWHGHVDGTLYNADLVAVYEEQKQKMKAEVVNRALDVWFNHR